MKSKISKGIGIINKVKLLLNPETLRTMYYSFVYPYFQYCIEVWGKASDIYINSVVKLQKKIVRIISNVPRLTHTNDLFVRNKILKVQDIYKYNISIFMYKLNHNMLPVIFNDIFTYNNVIHSYGTRQANNLHVPRCRTQFMLNCIRYQGVQIWNNIVTKVNTELKLATFKDKVKELFINDYNY